MRPASSRCRRTSSPSTDTGRFNLLIDGSSPNLGSLNVGDGGTTGEQTLDTGDHTVGESAVIGTDLADYAKSIECKDDNGTGSVVATTTSDDAGPLTVPVTTASDIVCVITNTRETGKLEVQKDLEPEHGRRAVQPPDRRHHRRRRDRTSVTAAQPARRR